MFSVILGVMSLKARLIVLGIAAAMMAASFGAGYAYHWHKTGLRDAELAGKQEVVTEVVTKTVRVTDTQAINRLQSQLAASTAREQSLIKLIDEAKRENPADPMCRISDGLRQSINDHIAPGARADASKDAQQNRGPADNR